MGLCLHVFGPADGDDEEPEEIPECDVGHYSDFGVSRTAMTQRSDGAKTTVTSIPMPCDGRS